jgi:LysR family hydrogen peroxide-inducible transcriptional activator
MTLTQLSYIVAVDTHRHFGKAAEQCFVTQPALSMHIRKLEEELGIQIFDRTATPIRPTDLGEQVIAQARVVLAEGERLREMLNEEKAEVAGELRLGILPTISTALLPLVSGVLAERFPRLELSVHELTTDRVYDALDRDQIDAGLIATPVTRPGLVTEALYDEPFVAYVNDHHRLAGKHSIRPRDLSQNDLWLLSEGHCFRDQVLQLCAKSDTDPAKRRRTLRLESGNLETVCRLVDRVGGITLLPLLETVHMSKERRSRLRPFVAPVPSRQISTVTRLAYRKRTLLRAFSTAVTGHIGAILEKSLR